jgi:hypothetical protein
LAHVGPGDPAGGIDDEDGRGSDAVAEQVINAIRFGDAVVGVSQDWEVSAGCLDNEQRGGPVVHSQSEYLGMPGLKVLILVLQIHDLLAADPSGLAPVKDEHHV